MSIVKETGKNMVDGLNLERELTWKKKVIEEFRRRVYPGDSDETIVSWNGGFIDRYSVSDSPKEIVDDYVEKYSVVDLDAELWMK